MRGHYHYGCEEYCERCLPVPAESADVDLDQGEQDTPANCAVCGVPLDCSLTSDGVGYVLEAMRDSLREGKAARNALTAVDSPLIYYRGTRYCEVVRDWAEQLKWYSLDKRDSAFVDRYLAWTADRRRVRQ